MDAASWAEIRRLFHRENWGKRRIARHVGVDPKTVRKALRAERFSERRKPARRSCKLDPFKDNVRALLDRYPDLSAVRVLQELRPMGYTGGMTIVGDLVRMLRPRKRPEAYLRIAFPPGDAAQVDWTYCGTLLVEGRRRRLLAFAFLLCHSRFLYVEFALSATMEVFLSAHERALTAAGGVPRRTLYDNLKSVVLSHVLGEVRFHPRFLDFSAHYGFRPVACAPYRPNEKGRVENVIRYLKGNFLAGREIASLEEANRAVRHWLDEVANVRTHATTRRRPVDLLAEERPLLGPLPAAPYDTRVVRTVRASPLCRVHFEGSTYSVPPALVGATLTLKASATSVSLYAAAEEVARHPRARGRGEDLVDPSHLRALTERKRRGERGALVARFLALCPEAEDYLKGLARAEIALYRHLRRLLALSDRYGRDAVRAALVHARGFGAYGADYVERIVQQERRRSSAETSGPLDLSRTPDLEGVSLPPIDLEAYDRALGTKGLAHGQDPVAPEPGGPAPGEPPAPRPHEDPRDLPGAPREGP